MTELDQLGPLSAHLDAVGGVVVHDWVGTQILAAVELDCGSVDEYEPVFVLVHIYED